MPKTIKALTLKEIEANEKPIVAVGGVNSLYYEKAHKRYFLRWRKNGKQEKFFIPKSFTLKEAREQAREWLKLLYLGINPKDQIKQKQEEKETEKLRQELAKEEKAATFRQGFKQLEEWQRKTSRWKNNSRGEREQSQRAHKYLIPVIGDMPLKEITWQQIADILTGIYQTQSVDVATKVKTIIRQVYNCANMQGYGNLNGYSPINETLQAFINPAKKNAKRSQHYPSLPYEEMPDFIKEVYSYDSTSAKAVLFGILTVTRSKACRNVRKSDLDLDNGIYWVREENDKLKHTTADQRRIFLAKPVIKWLKQLPDYGEFLFPSQTTFKPLDENAPKQFIKKLHIKKAAIDSKGWIDPEIKDKNGRPKMITFHGTARSSYRTWCADSEGAGHKPFNRDAVEYNLLHFNSTMNRTERAYNRAKLDKERLEIMEEWVEYCLSKTDLSG